jgi:O-antigen ligase
MCLPRKTDDKEILRLNVTIPSWLSTVLRVLVFAMLALLAQTYFWANNVPLALKACVAAIGVLTAAWPNAGLLVSAMVLPFARAISYGIFESPAQARFTEALVLAFLAGWVLSRFRRSASGRGLWPGSLSALLLSATLLASVLVEMGVLRFWKDYWWPYLQTLGIYFGRDYLTGYIDARPWVGGVHGLLGPQAAALFLEGLGLMWVVHISCARDAVLRRRLVYLSALVAVGAAVLSLEQVVQAWSTSGMALLDFVNDRRLSAHTTKVNVAASHYVLFLPVTGALVWGGFSRLRGAGIWGRLLILTLAPMGTLVLVGALWMTGSRLAMMSAIAALAVALVVTAVARVGRRNWWLSGGATAAGLTTIALLGYALLQRLGHSSQTWPILLSLESRLTMWKYGAQMVAAHPLFGVGIGQFRFTSGPFVVDPVLLPYWGSVGFPAHNHFVQMTAELGLTGGAFFAVMFAGILWRAWIECRRSHDAVLGSVIVGIVSFLITCMAGSPLAVEVVAFPFWIMLGVALAAGVPREGRDSRPGARPQVDDWRARLVAGFLVLLAVSVPLRIWQGTENVNYALASYGLADHWSTAGDDRDYKVVKSRATFFVYTQSYWLDVPVRRDVDAGATPVEVDLMLDGRIARHLTLADDQWRVVGFIIPPDRNRPYRRVDLTVTAPAGASAVIRLGRPDAKHQ